jgi:hypothetical protein
VGFYVAGNYFVVRELNSYIFGNAVNTEHISMGWLFWILTIATPVFYIFLGIRKKDHLFMWTGLGLISATIFTIRYYYHLMPVEWELLCGGAVMIAIAYGLIRYFKTLKYGFTSQESSDRHLLEKLNLESLVIAETFGGATKTDPVPKDFRFGGGSGGGSGAGGQF